MANIAHISSTILPQEYPHWRDEIISLIETSKLQAVLNVNKELLALYWKIGKDILRKQEELGWGAQVIKQLSNDLHRRFPQDDGYSERNLKYMRQFAAEYPDLVEQMKKKREDVSPDDYKKLLEEVATLKSQLKREKLRADFYEEMVAFGKEVYGIDLKKAGTK